MLAVNHRLLPRACNSRFDFGLGQFDRMFDQLLGGLEAGTQPAARSMPWACWEDEGHFHVEFELPGVKNEDVELVVEDGHLHLKYQRQAPEGERKYHHNHRRYGQFERTIALPDTVDADNVTAQLRDGVLYLTLAKLPQVQPKRIAVAGG